MITVFRINFKHLIKSNFIIGKKLFCYDNQVHNDVNEIDPINNSLNYETHIPTSSFQKVLLAAGSGVLSFFQPWRQDMISTFGETTAPIVLNDLYEKMQSNPSGNLILKDKPRIRKNSVDLDYLRKLPSDSLGKRYVSFLDHYKYSPDERMEVSFIDDPNLAYLMLRYREVHDLTHVILNQPTDMLGEVVVKWVEGLQTGLPMCVTGGFFGSLRLKPKQRGNFIRSHLNFAIKAGHESETILFYYFEKNWENSIHEIRKQLRIPVCPSPNLDDKLKF